MKVHASTITGKVDAGLAGWLNLRGLREAEFLAAKGCRVAKLVAAGKKEKQAGPYSWSRSSPCFFSFVFLPLR